MNWWGEPWPTAEQRASVCEDDAERIPVPVGVECVRCAQPIATNDRGVSIPYASPWPTTVSYHARCFLADVVGDDMASRIVASWPVRED